MLMFKILYLIFSVCLRLMTQKTQQTGGNSGWQKFLWEKIDKVLTGFFAIGLQRENNGNYWTILTKFMKIPLSLRNFLKFRQNIYIFKLSDNNNSQGYCYGRLPDTNSLENKKNNQNSNVDNWCFYVERGKGK